MGLEDRSETGAQEPGAFRPGKRQGWVVRTVCLTGLSELRDRSKSAPAKYLDAGQTGAVLVDLPVTGPRPRVKLSGNDWSHSIHED